MIGTPPRMHRLRASIAVLVLLTALPSSAEAPPVHAEEAFARLHALPQVPQLPRLESRSVSQPFAA